MSEFYSRFNRRYIRCDHHVFLGGDDFFFGVTGGGFRYGCLFSFALRVREGGCE